MIVAGIQHPPCRNGDQLCRYVLLPRELWVYTQYIFMGLYDTRRNSSADI